MGVPGGGTAPPGKYKIKRKLTITKTMDLSEFTVNTRREKF